MKLYEKNVIVLCLLLVMFVSMQAQTISMQPTEQATTAMEPDEVFTERIIITPPKWGFKTNLLYNAMGSINFGAELRTGKNTSVEIPFSYNPWTFSNNMEWKHILVQPEFRYWLSETFTGHFFGLHAHYAYYNIHALSHPPFSEYMNTHRFQGWLAGGGLSYGYRWNFNHRWAMEATIGVGYAYLDYDRFECGDCGEKLESHKQNYVGPTKIGLSLIYGIGSQRTIEKTPVPVPQPIIIYYPTFVSSFITPLVEAPKIRNEVGSVFLDFAVNSNAILPQFRNNESELQRLHNQLEEVLNDSYSNITNINIVGHSSIEGRYAHNLTLSERRVTSLKNHVKAIHHLPDSLFTVRGAGEDWATLDSLVAQSDMPEKFLVLEIIRGTGIFDGRERKLMELADGDPYRQMAEAFFPFLRRADYTLHYTVVPFTVEQGKEVFRTKPYNLSLNEMFLIAQTYAPRSVEYNELFETAARFFPDSDVANLNAAAAALDRRDVVSASHYLERVKEHNDVYWNNLGIWQYLRGEKWEAMGSFRKGGAAGANNAEELSKHLHSIQVEHR